MSTPPLLKLFLRLCVHIGPKRRVQIGFLFIFMILASFAEIVSIGAILPFLAVLVNPDQVFQHAIAQPFINVLNITDSSQLALPITILFSTGAILSALTRLSLMIMIVRFSHAMGRDFSIGIYQRTLWQPYSVHLRRNSSEVVAGISVKANAIVYIMVMPFLNTISSLMILIFISLTLIILNPMIVGYAFVGFIAIYGITILSTKKILLVNGHDANQKLNQLFQIMQEGFGAIRDVLISCNQEFYCQLYRNADLPLRKAQANIAIISNSPRFVIEALGIILISLIAYLLSSDSTKFNNSIPILGALALGAQRMLPLLQIIYQSWSGFRGGQASLSDTLDLLDQPLPDLVIRKSSLFMPFKKNITLTNLSFKYTDDGPLVLKDGINLSISKGSKVGFIGATGSGKSTLIDIIMGLLRPTSGSIKVDGVTVDESNHQAWFAHIAHVPQVIFLADKSISENIAFGLPQEKIDHNRVRQVAKKAQLAETIESWSEQYDTVVGERGVRLSGGQRQRIAIARAFYKKADVIVFDEATSSLDNETELAVMNSIESLDNDTTLFVVAHRLSTLKKCSLIVELKDGRIERIGNYEQIIEQKI